MAVSRTKYFYPPRPGNGAGTFSDNIVGLQTVNGGGLTLGVFDFNDIVTEKVSRNFNVGAFSEPLSLDDLGLDDVNQSRLIQATQFRVYPNYDVSQVLNFSLYGSLSERFRVSVTKIINFFPAAIEVLFDNIDFTTGATATNITYDSVSDETYFRVNLSRLYNPFAIEFSVSASTNIEAREIITSKYRSLTDTYLDYAISINGIEYKVVGFEPSPSTVTGPIGFFVSGQPFDLTATTYFGNYSIRPNDYIVDKVFLEDFDEVEKFLVNRLTVPEYTAFFQIPAQNDAGQFYTNYQQVTWPKDGTWNLSISSANFDDYLSQLQLLAVELDSYKTNLISRFLVTDAFKEFDTIGQKAEKVLQIYGRGFDQVKQFADSLAYMNSVSYNPGNNIPNQLLVNLSRTLGWTSNFSPITNEDFLESVFGNQNISNYPGYARALTPTELNYAFYRNLILNAAYLFKSKGTRRSIEFLLRLIGAPESLIEYNEHIYIADQRVNLKNFETQYLAITGGTYVKDTPSYLPGVTFKVKGILFSAFTSSSTYESAIIRRDDYPVDFEGYPKAPRDTEDYFFQLGAGWYELTPQHRSPEEVTITGNVYTGQNLDIQTQLQPFTYGQLYLDRYRDFPYMNLGFKLRKVIDNKKSWLDDDDKLRISNEADYNAYYYVGNEKLVLNVKNIDLFLNPAQGLAYDVWVQSRQYDYPIPESGLTVGYPVPGGVDWTYINPEPKKKTFFEFYQTFWENMINTRNRQYITDGKTGGYPTLQSIWWKYIQSEQTVGLPNNKYTYQKLIEYVEGIGPYWMKLVEQMIPATTIWQGGIKYENSVLHKQKFVYRRQRGCVEEPAPTDPCRILESIFPYTSNCVNPEFSIYPWLNGDVQVSNFSSILFTSVNNMLSSSGVSLTQCILNSITTIWYVELRIGNNILIKEPFYYGTGDNDVPTASDWRNALLQYLPLLYNYGYTFFINGNNISFVNLTSTPNYFGQELVLNTGIDININCNV